MTKKKSNKIDNYFKNWNKTKTMNAIGIGVSVVSPVIGASILLNNKYHIANKVDNYFKNWNDKKTYEWVEGGAMALNIIGTGLEMTGVLAPVGSLLNMASAGVAFEGTHYAVSNHIISQKQADIQYGLDGTMALGSIVSGVGAFKMGSEAMESGKSLENTNNLLAENQESLEKLTTDIPQDNVTRSETGIRVSRNKVRFNNDTSDMDDPLRNETIKDNPRLRAKDYKIEQESKVPPERRGLDRSEPEPDDVIYNNIAQKFTKNYPEANELKAQSQKFADLGINEYNYTKQIKSYNDDIKYFSKMRTAFIGAGFLGRSGILLINTSISLK